MKQFENVASKMVKRIYFACKIAKLQKKYVTKKGYTILAIATSGWHANNDKSASHIIYFHACNNQWNEK